MKVTAIPADQLSPERMRAWATLRSTAQRSCESLPSIYRHAAAHEMVVIGAESKHQAIGAEL